MESFTEWQGQPQRPVRRFRCSLYVDLFVPQTEDLEADRRRAEAKMQRLSQKVPNSYVGGVAHYTPGKSLNPLDREI